MISFLSNFADFVMTDVDNLVRMATPSKDGSGGFFIFEFKMDIRGCTCSGQTA